jgi:hypothetical protein
MKRMIVAAILLTLGCASAPPQQTNDDIQIEVIQELGDSRQAASQLLYLVLVSNISGQLMKVEGLTLEPIGAGDVRFKNGTLAAMTDLEPGEQGEFRLWADVQSDTGFYDREGPATVRLVVSYTIAGGETRVIREVYKVQRPSRR